MNDATKWGWMWDGDEDAHGPFDSREEALADANAKLVDIGDAFSATVMLGHCRYADPVDSIDMEVDHVLDMMDQRAGENDFGWYDDEIFEAKGTKVDAQKALTACLEGWAREWVETSVWTLDEVDRVELTRDC